MLTTTTKISSKSMLLLSVAQHSKFNQFKRPAGWCLAATGCFDDTPNSHFWAPLLSLTQSGSIEALWIQQYCRLNSICNILSVSLRKLNTYYGSRRICGKFTESAWKRVYLYWCNIISIDVVAVVVFVVSSNW